MFKQHNLEHIGGMKVKLHALQTLALDGGDCLSFMICLLCF